MSKRKPIDTSSVAAISLKEGYTLEELKKFIAATGVIPTDVEWEAIKSVRRFLRKHKNKALGF